MCRTRHIRTVGPEDPYEAKGLGSGMPVPKFTRYTPAAALIWAPSVLCGHVRFVRMPARPMVEDSRASCELGVKSDHIWAHRSLTHSRTGSRQTPVAQVNARTATVQRQHQTCVDVGSTSSASATSERARDAQRPGFPRHKFA